MRIALRTGGGRGVYELAGSQGEYTASDIFNKELYYEITPNLIIPGRARADKRQGKPRIKLDEQETTTHLYRLIASLLLLPKPKREFKTTGGDTQISFESYSITVIKIDISSVMPDKVIVRPTDILLASYSGLEQHVDFIERLSRIIEVWKVAEKIDSELATLLRNHKKSFYANDVNFKIVEKSAQAIASYLEIIYDPLEKIEALTEVEQNNSHKETSRIILGKSFGLEDNQSPQLARIETVKQWRKIAVRGSSASKFRQTIRESYRETCMFTGQKLPKMKSTGSAGVDAAHILPWAMYDINSVANGICINKQCHWAFDSGVIKLDYDNSERKYIISIPDNIKKESNEYDFDLKEYIAIVGPIHRSRLPQSEDLWPDPRYLNEFNKFMFG